MSVSPRDRLIITIGVAALIVIGLIAALIYPQIQQLSSLNAQVSEATIQADQAKLQLAQRQGFKDRAIETDAKWLRLMNQVPDSPDLPSFIIELQGAAYASGVQVIAVTPSEPVAKGAYSSIPVSMEIIGSWADTVDYMQRLMKLDRAVRPMAMTTKVTSNDNMSQKKNATLRAYAVDTIVGLETYLVPSTPTTPTP
jgi:Tfp pilus assembly protein PilO